jgi:hypothetical protein
LIAALGESGVDAGVMVEVGSRRPAPCYTHCREARVVEKGSTTMTMGIVKRRGERPLVLDIAY